MINFTQVESLHGIPVYYQKMPDQTGSVSLRWVIFTGSADDESVGLPGIYHWFEHIPFRGTKKFPNGNEDTLGRFSRFGGNVDASTGLNHTDYSVHLPKRLWKDGLSLITDLLAQPLLRTDDIKAEREIVRQEIRRATSSAEGRSMFELPQLLWPGHPLGHSPLGTDKTVSDMNSSLLQEAYRKGYDRSRCTLFVAGNISLSELLQEVSKCIELLPDNGLSKRQKPANYGSLPAWGQGQFSQVSTEFSASVVLLLFPIPPQVEGSKQVFHWDMFTELCTDVISPLFRIVREEKHLSYDTGPIFNPMPDGGYCGFYATTDASSINAVQQAFWDVINDPQLRSPDWHAFVKDAIRGTTDMRIANPNSFTRKAERRLTQFGSVLSDKDYDDTLTAITMEEITNLLGTLTPDQAHTIIFRGQD